MLPLLLLLNTVTASTVCMLCHCYARALADSARTARLGIAPLLSAVKKLAPSEEHLTPIHADVLHL